MKVLFFLSVVAAAVASINAICLFCNKNEQDHQEIYYEDLKYLEGYFYQRHQNTYKSQNITEQFRTIQNIIQKYSLFVDKAQETLQFSDPLNLVDTTEFFENGVIEYRNATLRGLENSIFKEINFDQIGNNLFSVYVALNKAEIIGDYIAANSYNRNYGHFYITLKNVEFKAQFLLDQFLEIRPEIDVDTITFNHHESLYTNEEVLKELTNENVEVQKPYAYYYKYLNEVIKQRLANEMTISFMPLIAKRFEQVLSTAVLYPTTDLVVPNAYGNIAPGIRANVYNTQLHDMMNTHKIQKMVNYTSYHDRTEMLFSFTSFDLRGTTRWALEFSSGNVNKGKAMFTVDNMQTIIVVVKPNNDQGQITIRFVKTIVNGLTMLLNADENCESIRFFAHQRIPKVLEQSLETFINAQSEQVLRNQITLIGEQYQH